MATVSQINTLQYNPALCVNCGQCSEVCPQGVFEPSETAVVLARPDACMECGACQLNCPTGAIKVESGVGCAYAMMRAALRGKSECSCGPGSDCCS